MACKVKTNRHGFLAFRLYWNGHESWEGTGLNDTPKNRERMEARAVIISEEMERGKFDYLKWFPEGNKAKQFKPTPTTPQTIGEYYRIWIERKKPPFVRKGLERDYRDQFRLYILPKFEDTTLDELSPALLDAFRSHLIHDRGLSIKSARNIIDATFRAMFRDARTVDYFQQLQGKDPFANLTWPRAKAGKPDPFTEQERDSVLAYFRDKSPEYYTFVYTLFHTGMRPSEALALRWGDVDVSRREIMITKSRYLDEEAGTKTPASERTIRVLQDLANLLSRIKPLHVTEETHVFLNHERRPINFHTWRAKIWYRALRAKQVRERRPYTMRHTFISVGLTTGVNPKWLADYCGTSLAMIEKHYGKYIRNDADEQLSRMTGGKGEKTETLGETVEARRGTADSEPGEKFEERVGGPTWTRTRDQPVMSRWL
jgi:integrase